MILDQLDQLDALLGRAARDRLLALGVTHGEQGRAALAAAFAADDGARVRAEAHRLRGAVSPFGVPALVAMLERVETVGDVSASDIDATVAAFVRACEAALAAAR